MDGLRRAGDTIRLPLGLLTRAWCSFAEAFFFAEATKDRPKHRLLNQQKQAVDCETSAQRDLDEAWEIAERGPMLEDAEAAARDWPRSTK